MRHRRSQLRHAKVPGLRRFRSRLGMDSAFYWLSMSIAKPQRVVRWLFLAVMLASAPASADGVLDSALDYVGLAPKADSSCRKYLDIAQDTASTALGDRALKWGSLLFDKVAGRFVHHTISSIEAGDNLVAGGLSGRFLGTRKVEEMTSEANRVLTVVLKDHLLSERFAFQLRRLGLLPHDLKHFDFSKFWILCRNEDLNLELPTFDGKIIEDDVVREYLRTLLEQSQKSGPTSAHLSPENEGTREEMLTSMLVSALNELDPGGEEKKWSLKSLDMALIEVGQLQNMNRLTPDSFDEVFNKLIATANFEIRTRKIPDWAKKLMGEIPYVSVAFKMYETGKNVLSIFSNSETLKNIKNSRHEIDKEDIYHRRTPKTLRIRFASRDVRNLNSVVQQFILKYVQQNNVSVFSNDFANDFLTAYPEVQTYFESYYTNEKLPYDERAGESFASYHPEIQKILYKAANFFSILREDASVFPDLDPDQLAALHQQMAIDLSLVVAGGQLNLDQLDLVLTSFVTTALGKARNPLIDSIATDFKIDDEIGGYNYNRRALFLLHHYRLLSYSFSRQTPANQKFLNEIMDHNYQSSLQELLRLEAPASKFELLHHLDATHLNFLFYMHLLSESKESHHNMTIAPRVLDRWLQLKALLVNDTRADVTTQNAYDTYIQWLQNGTKLNLDDEWDRVVLRVAALMGLPSHQVDVLQNWMSVLTPDQKELFSIFLLRQPVFLHRASDLFKVIMMADGEQSHSVEDSMLTFLDILSEIFRSIQAEHSKFARIEHATNTVNIFLKPIVDRLQEEDVKNLNLKALGLELHHYNYGYVIHTSRR